MRKLSKEEKRLYWDDSRVFADAYGDYYRMSMKEVRSRRKAAAGIRKFEEEKKRMTAMDAEKILRCDWYGDKLPKWLRLKYPQLSRGIPGKNRMNIQMVEHMLGRKSAPKQR